MKAGKLANVFAALEPEGGESKARRQSRSRRTSSGDAATPAQASGGAPVVDGSAATLGGLQPGEAAGEPGGQDPDTDGQWQPMVPRHSRHRSSSTGGSTGNLQAQLSAGSEALLAAADSVKAELEAQQGRRGTVPASAPPPAAPTSTPPRHRAAEHSASLEACQAATRQAQADLAAAQQSAAAAERAWRAATQAVDAAQARLSAALDAEGRAGGHTPPGRGAGKGGTAGRSGAGVGVERDGGPTAARGEGVDVVPGRADGQVAALGEELAALRVKIADTGAQVHKLRADAAAAGTPGQEGGKEAVPGAGEVGAAVAAVADTRPPAAPATAAPPAFPPPVAVPPASSGGSPHPGTPSAAGGVSTPSSGRRGWSTPGGETAGGSGGEGGGEGSQGPVDPTPAEALAAQKRRT